MKMKSFFENVYTTNIEVGDEGFDVDCHFDYQPMEPRSWDYPGCPEQASIYLVKRADTGEEIDLDPKVVAKLEEEILDSITQEAMERAVDEAEYRYEMEKERRWL
jgi:signal recognition particle subunit SEC65